MRQQDHEELQEHRIGVSSLIPEADTLKQLVAVSATTTTSRGMWPAEADESWHRQLTDMGLQLSRQPIQCSHLGYQTTSTFLLNEDISSLNRRTASRTELMSCLLAIMNYNYLKIACRNILLRVSLMITSSEALGLDWKIDQRNLTDLTVLEYMLSAWKTKVRLTVSLIENRHIFKSNKPCKQAIERRKRLF